ncbi:MAG: S41 family peptidase [Pseudoflavonifractor sp.]|nr:S41 family peptidase [Alloprevotella sp.]MCM1116444.1 S41 family peptidase [Pseudoflavonifractor sp.]
MKSLIRLFLLALIALPLSASAITRSPKSEVTRNLDIFNALVKELQLNYVDTIDIEKSIQTAINAMLASLDPYTEYMPRQQQKDFMAITSGEYGGIGSYIRYIPARGGTVVAGPAEDSPAWRSGLKTGDLIIKIDSTDVRGWQSDKVTTLLKGQAGTPLHIEVARPWVGPDSLLAFDLVREKIVMPSVPFSGRLKDMPSIGYLAITSFSDKTATEVKEALEGLQKGGPLDGIIIDLRGNGGGLLDAAVATVGYFVPKGTEVVRTRGRGAMEEKIYKTTSKPIFPSTPLAVLIDGNSASSSEITAGALQDLDRAVIIGNRSFGKGLVQGARSLPSDGMLKVTVAKYYIPSGRLIQAIDYSARDANGSVSRIPDSLTHVFHTMAGREVRDGGGITPDSVVNYPDVSRLTFNVVRDDWAFDFANKFAASHPTIGRPSDFVITDSIYSDFKSFIDPQRFNYDRVCESMLSQLREAAKLEGYMTDSVAEEFDRLGGMLRHSLSRDLDTHRADIEPYLAREIVSRYYGDRGEAEVSLNSDPAVDKAKAILSDKVIYRNTLLPPAKKK